MHNNIVVEIASVPDREELVAELWVSDQQLGEVRREADETLIQLYGRPDGQPWEVGVAVLKAAIDEAVGRLDTDLDANRNP